MGDRIAAKVEEICRTGTLRQLNHKTSNAENQALDLFGKVWGAGPTTAKKWFDMGLRTLDDLRERPVRICYIVYLFLVFLVLIVFFFFTFCFLQWLMVDMVI